MKKVEVAGRSPYDELYCPFCGESILHPERDDLGECPHLIYAEMEEEPDSKDFEEQDICLEFFEPAPAGRYHYFIFRPVP